MRNVYGTIYFYILLFLSLGTVESVAQTFRYSGVVLDSADRSPIAGVYVTYFHDGSPVSYEVTDADGRFIVDSPMILDSLKFILMGYKSLSLAYPKSGHELQVYLRQQHFLLREVTVRPEPMTVSGDTVTFDAASFTQQSDNSLSQVLMRLPGVSVGNTGTVSVDGKNISHFYIEDMDMLGGRYGIAVNNLRPEDISSIEILHRHQPVAMLRGIEKLNAVAVNIRLKNSAKSRWLFNVEAAAGGVPFIYRASADAMAFNRTNQSIIMLKSNNSGDNITRELASQNLGAGVYLMNELGEGIPDLFSVRGPVLPVPERYYFDNHSSALSVNQLWKLTPVSDLKYSLSVSGERREYSRSSFSTVTMPDQSELTIMDADRRRNDRLHINGDFNYTLNSDKSYVEEKLQIEADLDKAWADLVNRGNVYGQDYSLPKFNISNNLKAVFHSGTVPLTFESGISYRRRNQSMEVSSDSIISIVGTTRAVQDIRMEEFIADNALSFTKPVWKGLELMVKAGLDIRYSSLFTSLDSLSVNDVSLLSLSPYVQGRLDWELKGMEMSLDVPVRLRTDICSGKARFYPLVSPNLRWEYTFSIPFTLAANASVGNGAGDIQDLAYNNILYSYRSMQASEAMERTFRQYYSLSLSYKDLLSLFSVSLNGYWSDYRTNLNTSYEYSGEDVFYRYIKSPQQQTSAGTRLNLRKNFGMGELSSELSAGYSRQWSEAYLQQVLYEYEYDIWSASLGLGWTPRSIFELSYDALFYSSQLRTVAASAPIFNLTNTFRASVTPFKGFSLTAEFSHVFQRQVGYDDVSLPFLDVMLQYRFGKFRVFAECTNLINIKEYRSTYISAISTVHSSVELRGREFIAGFSVRF